MRHRNELNLITFILLMLSVTLPLLKVGEASEKQDIEFEIIDYGDISGYDEETYLIVKTEAEWTNVWKKHTIPFLSEQSVPEIFFSEKMVTCAFMGKRPTTGYDISVEGIWVEEGKIHVEIAKRSPSKNTAVATVLTYPYVFVSLERTDLEVVFRVTEENAETDEFIIPEFSIATFAAAFSVLSLVIVLLARKTPLLTL